MVIEDSCLICAASEIINCGWYSVDLKSCERCIQTYSLDGDK